MFAKYISLVPEIFLLINIIVMQITHWTRKNQTPKTFSTISKFFVGFALLGCIVFYNRSIDVSWYTNTYYTTFFKSLILFITLISNMLSCKWFLNQNQSSLRFYQVIGVFVLSSCLSVSGHNLFVLYIFLNFAYIAGILLIGIGYDSNIKKKAIHNYIINYFIFMIIFSAGIIALYAQIGDLSYLSIKDFYLTQPLNMWSYVGVGCIFIAIMYMLGVVPCHLMLDQIVKLSILPVSVFFSTIPIITGIAILVTLYYNVFIGISNYIEYIIILCGIFSIVLGAIGANGCNNIRLLFDRVRIFNIGILLLVLSYLTLSSLQSGIIYLLVYIISIFGVYTCFYGMRSHGEYTQDIKSISGMYTIKPYISAALLIFMISLLGIPPFLGMLGNLSVLNNLLSQKSYGFIVLIFSMLPWVAHGMLNIIKSIFFDQRKQSFDRADKGVYIGLLLNILFILTIVMKPDYLISNIEKITRLFLI